MSKVDEKLDELLDIQGEIVKVEKNLPTLTQSKQSKNEEQAVKQDSKKESTE